MKPGLLVIFLLRMIGSQDDTAVAKIFFLQLTAYKSFPMRILCHLISLSHSLSTLNSPFSTWEMIFLGTSPSCRKSIVFETVTYILHTTSIWKEHREGGDCQ